MSFDDFSSLLVVGLSVFDTLPFIGAGLGMGPFLLVVVSYSLVWCFGKGAYGTFNMRIRIYTSTEWEDGMGFDSLRVIACTATTITIDIWIYLFTSIHLYLRTHNLHYHVNNSLSLSLPTPTSLSFLRVAMLSFHKKKNLNAGRDAACFTT